MKYNLNPSNIELEIEPKEIIVSHHPTKIKIQYKIIARYTYCDRYEKYHLESQSETYSYDDKESAIKDAIMKLEWKVYYHKVCNNSYNKEKEL